MGGCFSVCRKAATDVNSHPVKEASRVDENGAALLAAKPVDTPSIAVSGSLNLTREDAAETLAEPVDLKAPSPQLIDSKREEATTRRPRQKPQLAQVGSEKKEISEALWLVDEGKAHVLLPKGRIWTTTGITRSSRLLCNAEETVYLVERGSLALHWAPGDVPAKPKDVYSLLVNPAYGCWWEAYTLYAHLRRLGFVVGRHGISWTLKSSRPASSASSVAPLEDPGTEKPVSSYMEETSLPIQASISVLEARFSNEHMPKVEHDQPEDPAPVEMGAASVVDIIEAERGHAREPASLALGGDLFVEENPDHGGDCGEEGSLMCTAFELGSISQETRDNVDEVEEGKPSFQLKAPHDVLEPLPAPVHSELLGSEDPASWQGKGEGTLDFDVHLPNSHFKKVNTGPPLFSISMTGKCPPSRLHTKALRSANGSIPVKFAAVSGGHVTIFSFDPVTLPEMPY